MRVVFVGYHAGTYFRRGLKDNAENYLSFFVLYLFVSYGVH